MSCQRFVDEVLAGPETRSAELRAHLAQCPACRELAAADRAARKLGASSPSLPAPIQASAVMRTVRRRRAAAGALSAAAAAALFVAVLANRSAGPAEPNAEVIPVATLAAEVSGYARQDPVLADRTYAAFRGLALWVAPPGRLDQPINTVEKAGQEVPQ